MNITHLETAVALGAGTIVALGGAIAVIRPILSKASHFLDDWTGSEERPGVPGVPGVMERLERLDERAQRHDDGQMYIIGRLQRLEAQVHPNGGSSMRDEIQQIKRSVGAS